MNNKKNSHEKRGPSCWTGDDDVSRKIYIYDLGMVSEVRAEHNRRLDIIICINLITKE